MIPADFPVCLYTTGSVAIGAVFTPDADDLQNDFQRHIQIDEIRFLYYMNGSWDGSGRPNSPGTNAAATLAGLVRVQLKMGRIDLTNGYVPTWLLGTRMQQATEVMNGRYNNPNITIWDYQRWKLPKPIIVPHGATLLPTFQYLTPTGKSVVASASNSPITIYCALVGRSLGTALPKILQVPYATTFIATKGGGQQSGNDQLVNKFNKPLHVQRFTGRIAVTANASDGDLWYDSEGFSSSTTAAFKLAMRDHAGYAIVPGMTPWDLVFDPNRKAFTANRILEPRGWYTAQLADQPSINYMPMIGMIGWREEELAL